MVISRTFNAGMNQDFSELLMPQGSYEYALNVRNGAFQNKSFGVITNTKGNKEIVFPELLQYLVTAAGGLIIKVIGSYANKQTGKIYWFVYRSDARHFIMEYNIKTNVISKVLINLDDTGNVDILKFDINHPIYQVNIVDGLMYWTDGNVSPRKINIEDMKNGRYSPVTEKIISAIKARPPFNPSLVGLNDNTGINNMKGRSFQFKYLFTYPDGERSAYSPASSRTISTNFDPDDINYYLVSVDIGDGTASTIELIGRIDKGDWFFIDSVTYQYAYDNQSNYPPPLPPLSNQYSFTFNNSELYTTVDQAEANLPFDNVPQIAQAQAFVNGTNLLYGNITEGYDNVDVSSVTMSVRLGTLTGTNNLGRDWKSGAKYKFGIVFFDAYGRSGTVNTAPGMQIITDKFWKNGPPDIGASRIISYDISGVVIPDWAVYYQIYTTGNLTQKSYLYWSVQSVDTDPADPNIRYIGIPSLELFNSKNPSSSIAYQYSVGDRLVIHNHKVGSDFVYNGADVSVLNYEPFVSSDDHTPKGRITIDIRTDAGPGDDCGAAIDVGSVIEIYTPNKEVAGSETYFAVGNVQSVASKINDIQYNYLLNNKYTAGDSYVRFRNIHFDDSTGVILLVEDPGQSDLYRSNFDDFGAPNVVDVNNKKQHLESAIRFSENKTLNTTINGLSRFYQLSIEYEDQSYGSIQRLEYNGNYLIMFQELNTASIPVFLNIVEDSGDAKQVLLSEKLLNKARYYNGGFGIGLIPTSMVRDESNFYFVCPPKKCVCRLAGDGINNISEEFRMNTFFSKVISSYNKTQNSLIWGGFDPKYGEYVSAFVGGYSNYTIGFSEKIKAFTSFYSYSPESMTYIENDFYSFSAGKIFHHDDDATTLPNIFYGQAAVPSQLHLIANDGPSAVKTFLSMALLSNSIWTAPYIQTETGQESNIVVTDFEIEKLSDTVSMNNKEGNYYADFSMDMNSPGGIADGDILNGEWIRIRLSNNDNKFVYLWSVLINAVI